MIEQERYRCPDCGREWISRRPEPGFFALEDHQCICGSQNVERIRFKGDFDSTTSPLISVSVERIIPDRAKEEERLQETPTVLSASTVTGWPPEWAGW